MTYNVRHFPMAIIFREKWKKNHRINSLITNNAYRYDVDRLEYYSYATFFTAFIPIQHLQMHSQFEVIKKIASAFNFCGAVQSSHIRIALLLEHRAFCFL